MDLDGIALSASKKDAKTALTFFNAYAQDMPQLIRMVE